MVFFSQTTVTNPGSDAGYSDKVGVSGGWYWPDRHDYYLYAANGVTPSGVNLNLYLGGDYFDPATGSHPHSEIGSYEDELYSGVSGAGTIPIYRPNLSCVREYNRTNPEVPNGLASCGNECGRPRYVLISPNIILGINHYGGVYGPRDTVVKFMIQSDGGLVFTQKALIENVWELGDSATHHWEGSGLGGQLFIAKVSWTEVYGPFNWEDYLNDAGYDAGDYSCSPCAETSDQNIINDPDEYVGGTTFGLSSDKINRTYFFEGNCPSAPCNDIEESHNIIDAFKFPLFLPPVSLGEDILKDVIQSYPAFLCDQDHRISIVSLNFGGCSDDLYDCKFYAYMYNQYPDHLDDFIESGIGASFDYPHTYVGGDSSSPYFIQRLEDDAPILVGAYSHGERFVNQLNEIQNKLSATGDWESLTDYNSIQERTLSRFDFGLPPCDVFEDPFCISGYELYWNSEYSLTKMSELCPDIKEYSAFTKVNMKSFDNLSILDFSQDVVHFGTPFKTLLGISFDSYGNIDQITNNNELDSLYVELDDADTYLLVSDHLNPTPQKNGDYIFVGYPTANHGETLDAGRVVILNTSLGYVGHTYGTTYDRSYFGCKLESNSSELFVSSGSHPQENLTLVEPKVDVYDVSGSDLTHKQTITKSHILDDSFGYSISATDIWMAISAPTKSRFGPLDIGGRVFLYTKNQSTGIWDYHSNIQSNFSSDIGGFELNADSLFGRSVSMNDVNLIIGCPYEQQDPNANVAPGTNKRGSIFIYEYNIIADSWDFSQKINIDDVYSSSLLEDDDLFGWSVSLQDKTLVVGCSWGESSFSGSNDNAGISFLFTKDENGTFIPRNTFDSLSYYDEKFSQSASLYENKSQQENSEIVTKRTLLFSKRNILENYSPDVYILQSESVVPYGDNEEEDVDYEPLGYGDNPDDRVLSGRAVIQDSNVWQDYSYLIDIASVGSSGDDGGITPILFSSYETPYRRMMHPAGLQFFGNARLDDVLGGTGMDEGEIVSTELGIVGHYLPYTFNTIQNLRYNQEEVDLYPEGYNAMATGDNWNGNTFALVPEDGFTAHSNLSYPYGTAGSSYGYETAQYYGYNYWMIFNHPNIWASHATGPSGSPENSGYTLGEAMSFGNIEIQYANYLSIDIVKVLQNAPGALGQSPNIGNNDQYTGNPLLVGLPDGPTGSLQY